MSEVRDTPELRRIRDLPRRLLERDFKALREVERMCRTPNGTMQLRPLQRLALSELQDVGGLFAPLGVGEGKTLISLLAATVLRAKRPLLLLPAALLEKTRREIKGLSKHWEISPDLQLMSYELLSRVQSLEALEKHQPDLLILDECHKTRHRTAVATRRISRYLKANPATHVVAMSGTIMRKSILDFAHILHWCLKENAPLPNTRSELEEWAAALDDEPQGRDEFGFPYHLEPGALMQLCEGGERIQEGFRRRLVETPGIVASSGAESERVSASIYIRHVPYKVKQATEDAFKKLRTQWLNPGDDYPFTSGNEVWATAKALALGLTYIWDPRPPKAWLDARRAWGSFVRKTISYSKRLDSERAAADAVRAGELDDDGALAAWSEIEPTFKPNPRPVWHDDSVLQLCAKWGEAAEPGIIWTEHAFFAERLSAMTGMPYYGAKGYTADGQYIEGFPSHRSIIVSADANREGRNLQHRWARNLIVSPNEGGDWWEQVIGRTHRPGQQADTVTVDVLVGCKEHEMAWIKATSRAHAVKEMTGAEQKLLLADIEVVKLDRKNFRWG